LFCKDDIFAIAVWAFDKTGGMLVPRATAARRVVGCEIAGNTNRRLEDIGGSETTRWHYQPGLFSGHRSNLGLRTRNLDAGPHSGVCQP
jgi:hypothetical protein